MMPPASRIRLLAVVGALFALGGCNSPFAIGAPASSDFVLQIIPDQDTFTRDDEATLRLENRSDDNLGYGACALRLDRRTGSSWKPAAPSPESCILILYVIRPGQHADFPITLSSLESGTYRYRMDIMPGTNLPQITIESPRFHVSP